MEREGSTPPKYVTDINRSELYDYYIIVNNVLIVIKYFIQELKFN